MDNIEKLYQYYETLNEAKDAIAQVTIMSNVLLPRSQPD